MAANQFAGIDCPVGERWGAVSGVSGRKGPTQHARSWINVSVGVGSRRRGAEGRDGVSTSAPWGLEIIPGFFQHTNERAGARGSRRLAHFASGRPHPVRHDSTSLRTPLPTIPPAPSFPPCLSRSNSSIAHFRIQRTVNRGKTDVTRLRQPPRFCLIALGGPKHGSAKFCAVTSTARCAVPQITFLDPNARHNQGPKLTLHRLRAGHASGQVAFVGRATLSREHQRNAPSETPSGGECAVFQGAARAETEWLRRMAGAVAQLLTRARVSW